MLAYLDRNLLKSTMLADGVVSLVVAVALFASSGIGGVVGSVATPSVVNELAVFFLFWGAFHLVVARQVRPSPRAVGFAIAGDALWGLGSIAVLAFIPEGLTLTGMIVIAFAATVVAGILLLKAIGLGRQQRSLFA